VTDPAQAAKDALEKQAAALGAELDRLIGRARTAAAAAGIEGEALVARGRAAAEAADACVHRAPIASAAVAFIAGCLVGRLLR
jgi:ElaB/YqjD/DUF883 family membrane-anchored ribosome-binding protein